MEELGDIISRAIHKHVSPGRRPVLEILAPLWRRAVGKFISQSSRPVAFADGRLTLVVWSPSWETQLRALAEPLRARINDFLGYAAVKKLSIRLQPLAETPASTPSRGADGASDKLSAEAYARLSALLHDNGAQDLPPELADVVERSFVKYFSRRGSGSWH